MVGGPRSERATRTPCSPPSSGSEDRQRGTRFDERGPTSGNRFELEKERSVRRKGRRLLQTSEKRTDGVDMWN